ncbi:MAG: sigma 54-interacting transcriptional regulator [Acidobacteria bacterium]|nr:sigma 54-interacting transcriptional regulator [Acidobacteriota bacterium]
MSNSKVEKKRFEILLEASSSVSAGLNLTELLMAVSIVLRKYIHHDFAGMSLFDEESGMFRLLALESPPEYLEEGDLIPLEGTPDGLAFKTRQAVWRDCLDPNEFPSPTVKKAFDAGMRSGCAVPLVSRDKLLGVLGVASNRESSITKDDAEVLQLIANQVAGAVDNALQFAEIERLKNQLAREKLYLEEELQSEYNFAEIIGRSPALKKVLHHIETVAPTDSCVFLIGETGTGKELFSRAIHNLSRRRDRTLVKLNCAAIPTGLLESELFGHEKGAFTGAVTTRVGRFELAHRGTLLLDEIGDIPLELQPKLLRVLQEREFERLGSSRTVSTDVRLIAATNCNLREMVDEKRFRSDLYYRLSVFPIEIPSLRERREDIPLLAGYFTQKHARRMSKRIESIPRESIETLAVYDFPGNVRELENIIERAVILTRGTKLEIPLTELQNFDRPVTDNGARVNNFLADVERNHIAEVLKDVGGRIAGKGGAAEILGLPASTLRHRMKKFGLLD